MEVAGHGVAVDDLDGCTVDGDQCVSVDVSCWARGDLEAVFVAGLGVDVGW